MPEEISETSTVVPTTGLPKIAKCPSWVMSTDSGKEAMAKPLILFVIVGYRNAVGNIEGLDRSVSVSHDQHISVHRHPSDPATVEAPDRDVSQQRELASGLNGEGDDRVRSV